MKDGTDSLSEDIMTLSEVASYLKVSEKTISRMIRMGEIPAAKVSSQWRFLKPFLDDWLMMKMQGAKRDDLVNIIATGENLIPISRLVSPERVVIDMKRGSKRELLHQLVAPLSGKNILSDGGDFVEKLLEREAMVSTAVGRGVALPHLRDPDELQAMRPSIILGICKEGADFDSLDGEPTYIFALCLGSREIVHLRLMAKISFLLKGEGVVSRLRSSNGIDDVMAELVRANVDLTVSL